MTVGDETLHELAVLVAKARVEWDAATEIAYGTGSSEVERAAARARLRSVRGTIIETVARMSQVERTLVEISRGRSALGDF